MMILRYQAFCLVFCCPGLVWNSYPFHSSIHAFQGGAVDHHLSRSVTKIRQFTRLHPHRFNGGYDPTSPLTWTPQQAAEFTIFHDGSPEHAGMQLRTAVQHWSGTDLAEFLTRLYLGHLEIDTDKTGSHSDYDSVSKKKRIVYEPQNVRSPQWEGLETREGIFALKGLLREALSKELLSAQEISRFAEAFLLKDYIWPSSIGQSKSQTKLTPKNITISDSQSRVEVVFDQSSFYSLGHARTLARVMLAVRKDRGYHEFNWNDIALMVTLPEKRDEDREITPLQLIEFLRTIAAYTPLTATDKANIVQRMAISGWSSGSIPGFMAELFPDETLSQNHMVDQMCRLQGDSFFDFPAAATIKSERESTKEKKNAAAIAVAKARAKGVVKNDNEIPGKTPSKILGNAKDSEGSEYEELVQSYWKKVEVTTTIKPKIQPSYGVPKTKSIKMRNIPKKGFDLSITKGVVDSQTKSMVNTETEPVVNFKSKSVINSKTKYAVSTKTKSVPSSKTKSVPSSKTKSVPSSKTKSVPISKTKSVPPSKTKSIVSTKTKSIVKSVSP